MMRNSILCGILCICILGAGAAYYRYAQAAEDTTPPVITAQEETLTAEIGATNEELCAGLTAMDDRDGDLTDHILVGNIQKKEDGAANEFLISYKVFDSANNEGTFERTLIYPDYRQTRFSLGTQLRFPANQEFSILEYVTADDCIDGDVTPFVTIEGDDGVNLEGELSSGYYTGVLRVTNSVGATTEVPIGVEVYEDSYEEQNSRPEIILKENIVYVTVGGDLDMLSNIDSVTDRGDMQVVSDEAYAEAVAAGADDVGSMIPVSRITIDTSLVDMSAAGVYTATYSYVSEKTGMEGTARLIIVVG